MLTVNPTPIEYKQYVLVEDYTGTWWDIVLGFLMQ